MTTAKIVQIVLLVHIFFGALGLTAGTVALLVNKTLWLHKIAGKIFFYSMLGIFLTSIYMSIVSRNIFLFLVGFFSFYLAAAGYRILFLKKLHVTIIKPKPVDYLIVITGIISGLAIIGLGLLLFSKGNIFWVVCSSFGFVSIGLGYKDAVKFKYPPTDKTHWIKSHASRMAGAYTATVTAFIVVNVQKANGWILWILPALLIIPTTQKIVDKFLTSRQNSN